MFKMMFLLQCLLSLCSLFSTLTLAKTDDSPAEGQQVLPNQGNGNTYTSNPSLSCCDSLAEQLGPIVLTSTAAAYNDSLTSYWSSRESEIQPSCILRPTSTKDVSTALLILSTLNHDRPSHPPACQFAIRGGGHTPWPGASNIKDGVTIDLSGLNKIELAEDKKMIIIGGGQRWSNVYAMLDPLNLAIPGGRVTGVGVGGLATGGGISFFSPRYGFVCDNIESYELVGPYGKVVNISAENDAELFRALKGGGNNFGIVTAFRMKTFESGEFWGGQKVFNISTAQAQFEAFERLAGSTKYDEYAHIIQSVAIAPGLSDGIMSNAFQYTKVPAQNETPQFFNELVGMEPSLGEIISSPTESEVQADRE